MCNFRRVLVQILLVSHCLKLLITRYFYNINSGSTVLCTTSIFTFNFIVKASKVRSLICYKIYIILMWYVSQFLIKSLLNFWVSEFIFICDIRFHRLTQWDSPGSQDGGWEYCQASSLKVLYLFSKNVVFLTLGLLFWIICCDKYKN